MRQAQAEFVLATSPPMWHAAPPLVRSALSPRLQFRPEMATKSAAAGARHMPAAAGRKPERHKHARKRAEKCMVAAGTPSCTGSEWRQAHLGGSHVLKRP